MIPASTFSADALLAELLDWVRIESPTYDAATVNRMEDFIAPKIGALGFEVEKLPGRDGLGGMLCCRRAGRTDGPGILMIAHADTAHPVGTLATKLPIRRGGRQVLRPGHLRHEGRHRARARRTEGGDRRQEARSPRHHHHQPRRGDRQPDLARADRGRGAAPQVRADPRAGQGRAGRCHDRPARLPALLSDHARPARALGLDQQGRPLRGARHGPDRGGAGEPVGFRQRTDLCGQRLSRRAVGQLRADDLHGPGAVRRARTWRLFMPSVG